MIEDLLTSNLPEQLRELLAERYHGHSGEYALQDEFHIVHVDGQVQRIPVNACMRKDNLQDVEEELVDAIFNCLVYKFRNPDDVDNTLLNSLLNCWSVLGIERRIYKMRQEKEGE